MPVWRVFPRDKNVEVANAHPIIQVLSIPTRLDRVVAILNQGVLRGSACTLPKPGWGETKLKKVGHMRVCKNFSPRSVSSKGQNFQNFDLEPKNVFRFRNLRLGHGRLGSLNTEDPLLQKAHNKDVADDCGI